MMDGPLTIYSINEYLDNFQNDYAGNNWQWGVSDSSWISGDEWTDTINFMSAWCASQPCVPLPSNPGPDFIAVHNANQKWSVGSQTPGQGAAIQTNILRRYTDEARHEGITNPAIP